MNLIPLSVFVATLLHPHVWCAIYWHFHLTQTSQVGHLHTKIGLEVKLPQEERHLSSSYRWERAHQALHEPYWLIYTLYICTADDMSDESHSKYQNHCTISHEWQRQTWVGVKPAAGRRATSYFSCDLIDKRAGGPLGASWLLSTIAKPRGRSYSKVPKLQWKRREGLRKE